MNFMECAMRLTPKFSLRVLLIAVTILAVSLGLRLRRIQHQKRAIAEIASMGGEIYFEYNYANGGFNPDADSPMSRWLYPIYGPGKLRTVHFSGTTSDDDLKVLPQSLAQLPNFTLLSFDHSNIGDATLAGLKGSTNFSHLNLDGTRVTDQGLAHVLNFQQLESISIVFTDGISADGLNTLAKHSALQNVTWSGRNNDVGILAAFSNLQETLQDRVR
jgi:hypothetical protein